jgi:hypothetical protein
MLLNALIELAVVVHDCPFVDRAKDNDNPEGIETQYCPFHAILDCNGGGLEIELHAVEGFTPEINELLVVVVMIEYGAKISGLNPVIPVLPVGPVGPVIPVNPVIPVGPVFPVNPVVPVVPVGPLIPVGPVFPVNPVVPVGPV